MAGNKIILSLFITQNRGFLSGRLFVLISLFLGGMVLFLPAIAQTQTENPQQQKAPRPLSLLVHAQYGYPFQYVSEILYENFQVASLSLSLEKECGLWPFFGNKKLVESLLLEFRLSKIWGQDIPLVRDQVSPAVWNQAQQEGQRPTTNWDLYQVGLTPYYRLYYPLSPTVRVYGEAGLGITLLNKPLIEEGTQWNFLLTGGLGLDWKIKNQHFYFNPESYFTLRDGDLLVVMGREYAIDYFREQIEKSRLKNRKKR